MFLKNDDIIQWLLEGDVSIQYQVYKDLLGKDRKDLQARIEKEGWGKAFLDKRHKEGHWGQRFYQPKWISSHYTLLDLRNLWISSNQKQIQTSIKKIVLEEKGIDGGINPAQEILESDVCVNGMVLSYACYFGIDKGSLHSIIDYVIEQAMPDGGFNCRKNRSGAVHSSMHSTISLLEGIEEYILNGYQYKLEALKEIKARSIEFLLMHKLFKSDITDKIIHKDFLKLSYPSRWKYDILRAMDYFQFGNVPWDDRMQEALDVIIAKRNKQGLWNVQAYHPGQLHFKMEAAGKSSRWNTLRVLRVLKHFIIQA